jgi:Helix-turn-helix domain
VTVVSEAQYSSRRVGELARMLRRRAGHSRKWVAREAGVTRAEVRALERGSKCPTETSSVILGVLGDGKPICSQDREVPRLDTESQILSVAGNSLPISDANDPDTVLQVYLDLVCVLRGERRRPDVALRTSDLDELSNVLHMPVEEVSQRLLRLMGAAILAN